MPSTTKLSESNVQPKDGRLWFATAVELVQLGAVFFESIAACVAPVLKHTARKLLDGLDLG